MPTYRYRAVEAGECELCAEGFETLQKLSDPALVSCPECDTPIRRVIGTPQNLVNRRWNTKKMLSDGNLKKMGFKKLVKEGDGKYRDVLAD